MCSTSAVTEFKPPTKSSSFLDKLSNDLSKLYLNKLWSDVKIICNGKSIYCHKSILAARSGYFETRFSRDEDLQEIIEDNGSELTLQLILRYIYTGIIGCDDDASEDVLLGVLSLAIKYQLAEVVDITVEFIKPIITPENVLKIFAVTSSLKGHDFLDYCSNFISNSAENLLKSEEFNQLNMEIVIHLFKHVTVANELKTASLLTWIKRNRGADAAQLLEAIDANDESSTKTGIKDDLNQDTCEPVGGTATADHLKVSSLMLKCESYTTDAIETKSSQEAIIYKLPATISVNAIKMSLANTVGYKIWVSTSSDIKNENKWVEVVDYLEKNCRSEQELYFESQLVRLVKIVGSTAINISQFRIYHIDTTHEMTDVTGDLAPILCNLNFTVNPYEELFEREDTYDRDDYDDQDDCYDYHYDRNDFDFVYDSDGRECD